MNQPTNRPRKILAVWATALSLAGALHAQPAGLWNFTSGDLAAEVGQPLTYAGSPAGTSFGTTTSFGIADIGGQPANVMKMDAAANNAGYRMPVTVGANGGGGFVNNYTLVVDVFYPADSAAVKRPLLETDLGIVNTTAGVEFFINPAGEFAGPITALGSLAADTWYRLGIVVDAGNNQVRLYINGVEQGSFAAGGVDGRLALNPSTEATPYAELFRDLGGATALAYVNSIQFRDAVLTKGEMQALAGPSAAGIPATIPDVPSFAERWVPSEALAPLTTPLGVVLNSGSSILSNFAMTLNGAALTVSTSTDGDGNIVVTVTGAPALQPLTDYTLAVSYTDSKAGAKTLSNDFRVPIFFEDFEGLALGPNVDYTQPPYLDAAPAYSERAGEAVWTPTPPTSWVVDQTSQDGLTPMYGIDPPDFKRAVVEFQGWTFVDKEWWATTAGDQRRTEYLRGKGTVAVADPDEWDDRSFDGQSPDDLGRFNSKLVTPAINISAAATGTAFLAFDSSTRTEEPQEIYITISYDGGAETEILRWTPAGSNFKPDAPNERVLLPLNNPQGATSLKITFGLEKAQNDWWWAIDNIAVDAGVLPPTITQAPQLSTATEGDNVHLTVVATGDGLSYQWFKGPAESRVEYQGVGATSSTISFNPVTLADDGFYSVRVSNTAGFDFSTPVRLLVLERFGGQITDDLVLHLTFDGDLTDSSGRNNNGTPLGSPSFGPGRLGSALEFSTTVAGGRNYVTLGAPADLNFGASTDFTVSFWTKYTQRFSDPAFIGNKDWDSGNNQGWVLAASGNGIKWNMGYRPGFRPNEGTAVRSDSDGLGLIQDDNWHHVLASFDRDGVAVTYVNGVLVSTVDLSTKIGQNIDTPTQDRDGNPVSYAVNIGEDGTGLYNDVADGSPGFGDAKMDDLGIWRRALSADEAKAIYRAGLAGMDLTGAQTAPPVAQDLVAYLDFENDLTDGSGRGNNGTAVGNVPFVPGRVGQGVHVVSNRDGSSFNYVTLGAPADLNFGTTTSFSIAFWAQINSWQGDPAFLGNKSWNSGNNVGWVLATAGDGRIQWNIAGQPDGTSNGNRRDYDSAGGFFNNNAWRHVVVVFERVAGVGIARTFVDGVLINTTEYAGTDNNVNTLAGLATNIGQDGTGSYTDGGSVGIDAVIDEVMIWRRPLSAVEATGLYAAGVLNLAGTSANPDLAVQLPPGSIAATPAEGTLNFQWDPRQGVRLQSTPTLSTPNWLDVPGSLGLDSFTVPIGNDDAFFRLYRP